MKTTQRKSELVIRAEELANKCEAFAKSLKPLSDCEEVVLEILRLAMLNREVIHIFPSYYPHVNDFDITVLPKTESYASASQHKLYENSVKLVDCNGKSDSALKALLAIEDKLLELIAEAKDKQEVAA
ncbi:hypothetical protein [Photobacterium galatheae]|uniref:Uncharacterized protein n=1 Tax=Photobacterium galatheae TaxID=1654360 RepID=A0A066RQR7_9GAMM|nr:hypothetical protein [Photobacterium galatheae]KDM89718.1 hypothetical protein EA58_21160 [Photobacterium galatheae]MCM0151530.1 hypothetical protein [Photobacterium galatheae]